MALFPNWLHIFSSTTLMLGALCASVILVDAWRHPPEMVIMARVWPICALFGTVAVVWLYFRYGRGTGEPRNRSKSTSPHAGKAAERQPFPVIVAKGTLHCGAGCTLGDIMAEWLAYALPVAAIVFGWHWLFGEKTWAVWTLDFFFAFGFGIVFQYFAIVPMRHLPPGEGILAALKADAISLAAWQVGMYFTMGCLQYGFQASFGGRAPVDSVEFWGRNATRNARRLRHELSHELVVDPDRHQGGHVVNNHFSSTATIHLPISSKIMCMTAGISHS